jgi:DNA invertase Pin-like site-specific DNA recombinase
MNYLLGYARVSTSDQKEDHQVDALTAAGCHQVFTDHASGALDRRPQLARLLGQLRPGDTLVVWKLDRLGRSLRRLIELINELGDRGVEFKSLTEEIDTRTPSGKFLFHVMGAFAEMERDLIRERTRNGLAAARARGRRGGRRPVLDEEQAQLARELYASRRYTVAEIARRLRVGRSTLYRYLEAEERAS